MRWKVGVPVGHNESLLCSPPNALSTCRHGQCGPHCAALTSRTLEHLAMGAVMWGLGASGMFSLGREALSGEATLLQVIYLHINIRMVSANTNMRSEKEQNRK